MPTFKLKKPPTVVYKDGAIDREEQIAEISAGPLVGEPDAVELAARDSLLKTAVSEDGGKLSAADVEGLDISGGIRIAFREALERARGGTLAEIL
jgi:hypothetical protein